MPLSNDQRRAMERHIRASTDYSDLNNSCNWIIDSVETIMHLDGSHTCDLYLPNCFIDVQDKAEFWYKMAGIATNWRFDWHEMEFGPALNADDRRERFVYTWTGSDGQVFKFYTKTMRTGRGRQLQWFISSQKGGIYDDLASDCDTDSEDLVL